MNIVDKEQKLISIMDYYNQAIAMTERVELALLGFKIKYGFDLISDDISQEAKEKYPDIERIVAEQKKANLIDLGSIGERIMKYIILSNQLYLYPSQTIEEFNNFPMYKIVAADSNGRRVRNYYNLTDTEDMKKILAYRDKEHSLQPLHDYSLLYKVISILYENIIQEILQFLELNISKKVIAESNLDEDIKASFMAFPQKIMKDCNDFSEDEKRQHREEFEKIIKTSGDSFTVLRYVENNQKNKSYDIKLVLEKLKHLIEYMIMVHEMNHDDPNANIQLAINKKGCYERKGTAILKKCTLDGTPIKEAKEKVEEGKSKIDKIFEIDRYIANESLLEAASLYTYLTYDELVELSKEDIEDSRLYTLLRNNINLTTYNFYREHGITESSDIIQAISNNKYTIAQLKAFNLPNEEFVLLIWLDIDTIKELKKHPNIYNFLIKKPFCLDYFFSNLCEIPKTREFFKVLIESKLINEHPDIFELLNYRQISVFEQLNSGTVSEEEIVRNIQKNFEYFSSSKVFRNITIMLDADNNKKICDYLMSLGISEEVIANIESNIFCIDFEIVKGIMEAMLKKGYPIIEEGRVSERFYSILFSYRKSKEKPNVVPLPLKHLKV